MLCGEIPYTVTGLIHTNRKWVLQQIRTLCRNKYLSVTGNGDNKTIRITEKGVNAVGGKSTPLYYQYRQMIGDQNMRSDFTHVYKNHRVAEAIMLMKTAGIGAAYFEKPLILTADSQACADSANFSKPVFYTSREIKSKAPESDSRIRSARMTGLYVCEAGIYSVYNAYRGVMALPDEMKIRNLIRQLVMPNNWHRADIQDNETISMRSVLICRDIKAGIKILTDNAKGNQHKKFSAIDIMDNGFKTAHFIPFDESGVKMLKILSVPEFQKKIKEGCLKKELRTGQLNIEADGYDTQSGTYIYLFFDSDLKRFLRFYFGINGLDIPQQRCVVACYTWQLPLVISLLPDIKIECQDIADIESLLGIGGDVK